MPLIAETLHRHARQLGSRLEAELVTAHGIGKSREWLYAHGNEALEEPLIDQVSALVHRRLAGEPIAYILGRREFYGRDFTVTPAVLIPRPETELVVELTLDKLSADAQPLIDVGTGSGCIALTLAAERPAWSVTAVDLSADALAVCAENARRLGLERVRMLESDLLSNVSGERFAAIVSNPPYVAAGDPHLDQGDLRFEPAGALSAGASGLILIERLIEQAQTVLEARGWLVLEHGHDQGPAVRELMAAAGMENIESHRDLASIERVTLARQPD
ncbi:MAG: peptide chain release factor N(5)-glutamine methyltransferase [Wenzhouxiangella sp.]|jgi:release factor glutamine methyltransferase|nr:peptide chain release factor N(5)-glutamine methyltransferase [Wenzhouxiangella sp.]